MIKDGTKRKGLEGMIWNQIALMVGFNWAARKAVRKYPNSNSEYTRGKIFARTQSIKWLREDLANV